MRRHPKTTRQAHGAMKHAMYGTSHKTPFMLLDPQNNDNLSWSKLSVGKCRKCGEGHALWYGLCRGCRRKYIKKE